MKNSLEYDYQSLNQLSYSKTNFEASFVSLYSNGVFLDEVSIYIDDTLEFNLEYIILNSTNVYLKDLKALNQKGNPIAFSTYLCKCVKCGTLLIDSNPEPDAVKHNIYVDENKGFLNEDNIEVIQMGELKFSNSQKLYFRACPKCERNYYLIEIV